ncbi:MAG: YigZ family protein [Bacteroidota bacterium]
MEEKDTYKTIASPSREVLFKDRKSKFYGYAFPISSKAEVKSLVETLRKQHHTANHVCYAWQLGAINPVYRANDDGEPNNSAGMPIYGQIQSFGVTNVLVAVVRFFGGTKLGVGGLIQAYKATAQMALEQSRIVEKVLQTKLQLDFGYPQMDKVMRGIKQRGLSIISQNMELNCSMVIAVRQSEEDNTVAFFNEMLDVNVKRLD